MTYTAPPPGYPPAPPRRSRTNAVIIGSAGVLIAAIVGTGLFVAHSRGGGTPAGTPAGTTATASASQSGVAGASPACRAWIARELRSSGKIDAASGYPVCGQLSEAELGRAIDEVTAELMASASATPTAHATGRAACKKAIKAQYEPGTSKLKDGAQGRPAECAGLSTDEVSAIALEVVSENTR